jgi:hypothetical protein
MDVRVGDVFFDALGDASNAGWVEFDAVGNATNVGWVEFDVMAPERVYVSGPVGPGYTPRRNECMARPSAIQRNKR